MDSFESFFSNYKSVEKKVDDAAEPWVLNQRYLVGEKLAEGGLSEVYRVKDLYSEYFQHDRDLAVKIPNETYSKKDDIDAFFYAEYVHLLSLNHQKIIKVFDFGIDKNSNTPFLILQRLKGSLLSEIPLSSMNDKLKKKLFIFLYSSLTYIHKKGIVHADINPTNIFFLQNKKFCLFDFGISLNTVKSKPYNLSYSKNKAFNKQYSAPEIIKHEKPSFYSDIFSFCVIVYELYYKKLPYNIASTELKINPILKKDLSKIPLLYKEYIYRGLSYGKKDRKKQLNKLSELLLIKKTQY